MKNNSFLGTIGAIWGIIGWVALIGYAVYKLSIPIREIIPAELEWYHWTVMVLFTVGLFYFKGYRAFQQVIAPRIAVRARYIRSHPRLLWLLLAPLFSMGYFHIARRKQIVTFVMTVTMVALIILVRQLPDPWRGIVDVSIFVSLGWGIVCIIWFGVKGLTAVSFPYPTHIEE